MSDFIYWNIVFAIAWILFTIVRWTLPKGVVFSVINVRRSNIHGQLAVVLINDKRVRIFRKGALWRYEEDGRVLPEEWGEILDKHDS